MKKITNAYNLTENSTSLYIIIMVLVFPLFFRNDYFNILESKTLIFTVATWSYLILFIVLLWLESVFRAESERKLRVRKKNVSNKASEVRRKWLKQDLFFIVFIVAIVVSTLCSGDIVNAWYSPNCKLFGTRILLLCCGLYLCVSKGYVINKAVQISFAAGIGIVYVLSVLNRYGIDPLQMQSRLIDKQKVIYISTIGNVNILAGFICIFLPLLIGVFIYSDKLSEKCISIFLIYVGVMAGVSTNSDSFLLGFGVCMIFFMWSCMTSKEKVIKYLQICIIATCSMVTLVLANKICSYEYVWRSLQETVINRIPWVMILIALIIATVVLAKIDLKVDWINVRRAVFLLIICGLTIFAIYVIKVNVAGDTNVNKLLIFNEKWGTNRGFVWVHTCELFRELPMFNQLFGIGPGKFDVFFESYNEVRAANGLPDFVDPHSEYLYYLVSTGVVGLIGYVGMVVSALVKCLKEKKDSTIIIAAILLACLAQGTVNNPLVFTTPYLFIFLAMSRYEFKNNNKTEGQND